MSDELKQCPFCGGEAKTRKGAKTGLWFMDCPNCCMDFCAQTEDELIARWNARAERTAMLTYEYTEANGWRERLGRCQCGNLIEVAEFVGGGGNGDYMVVQSSPYCEMCGAKVVTE